MLVKNNYIKNIISIILCITILLLYNCHVKANDNSSQIIFIGDSRTVGMYQSVYKVRTKKTIVKLDENNDIWIAKVGAGLKWMESTALPVADKYIQNNTTLIILMGVNDCKNESYYKEYIKSLNSIYDKYKDRNINIIYVSLNPISNVTDYSTKNINVIHWNNNIRLALSSKIDYFDTYSELVNSAEYTDGLHYKASTSEDIYNLIMEYVRPKEYTININKADNIVKSDMPTMNQHKFTYIDTDMSHLDVMSIIHSIEQFKREVGNKQ